MKKPIKSLTTYFFEDKPLFGLDIGHQLLRVMQVDLGHKVPLLKGYGSAAFESSAIVDGVIVRPELIAKVSVKMFNEELIGTINTNRVAISLPASRAITRAVQLPKMTAKDIDEAVQTEIEQYIPNRNEELYVDYTIIREEGNDMDVFVVAMPKKIVDSYLVLARMLGLEPVLFDTSIGANARLFAHDKHSNIPSVLIDFGTESANITVVNHGLVVTGTVAFGGDNITQTISEHLHVTPAEAVMLKTKYGLSSSAAQEQIVTALQPALELLIKETRRTVRYYEQRYIKEPPIGQIITMGGGANMPGLADYLTEQLRLPVRSFGPATHIQFGALPPFKHADRMSYATVAGLAVTNPAEIFA
ncbi:MAG TPA: type IV pilus assembly protein PilM [Patescibacteria group bacterium]|nr:type IV pilus assembly protein PilM [Patescibacteria group bacterium]